MIVEKIVEKVVIKEVMVKSCEKMFECCKGYI